MAHKLTSITVAFLLITGCAGTFKNACQPVCDTPYNYFYHVTYDSSGRVSDIAATTRFTINFDNQTITTINTAPEAPSGIARSAWENISKFFGNIIGSIF